jgi:phosphatidylinositol alpha-1,6-mannosyltransferase
MTCDAIPERRPPPAMPAASWRILLLSRYFPPEIGGVGQYWANMIPHFARLEITLLTPMATAKAGLRSRQGVELVVKRLRCFPKESVRYSLRWILCVILTSLYSTQECLIGRVDYVVIGHGSFSLCLCAWLTAMATRTPYILVTHGEDIPQRRSRSSRLLKFFFSRATGFVCNSEFTAARLRRFLARDVAPTIVMPGVEDRFFQVPDPMAVDAVRKTFDLQSRKTVYTIARLDERKGQDRVIEALPQIIRAHPNVVYLMSGSGPRLEQMKDLAHRCGVEGHVRFAGVIPADMIVACHYACDVFVMPNRELCCGDTEGFGIVFLEANAAGKPAVAGSAGGAVDAVVDGVTGMIVNGEDSADIASAICRLLGDASLARSLGEAGRKRAWERFRWQIAARKFEDAIAAIAVREARFAVAGDRHGADLAPYSTLS